MIKRRISTVIIVILGFLLQTTVFQALKLANVAPNILLTLTVCYAYLRGRSSGVVIGFFCGLLLDMMYGDVIGLYAFILMTIGFLCGYCRKIYFTDNYILPCTLVGISNLLYGIFCFVTGFLVRGRLTFGYSFTKIILPEMVYTLLISIVIYHFLNMLEKVVSEKREEA